MISHIFIIYSKIYYKLSTIILDKKEENIK